MRALERGGPGLAVFCIDLDRFKLVNDSLGHEAADRLLVEVARRLRETLRAADTVARLGDDELIFLCEDCPDSATAHAIANRLTDALSAPLALDGRTVYTSGSIGVLIPGELPAADLRRALETDELVPYFQPIVETRTGAIRGFEALASWEHPKRGLVPPGEFLPICEETGLIMPLGRRLMREGIAQIQRWREWFGAEVKQGARRARRAGSHSTTSAPATRRSPTSASCRSRSSRSTARS